MIKFTPNLNLDLPNLIPTPRLERWIVYPLPQLTSHVISTAVWQSERHQLRQLCSNLVPTQFGWSIHNFKLTNKPVNNTLETLLTDYEKWTRVTRFGAMRTHPHFPLDLESKYGLNLNELNNNTVI